MNRYMQFDIRKFIIESQSWDKEIREKERELENVSELKSGGDSQGRSSVKSDPVASVVQVRTKIQWEISRLNTYKQAYEEAFSLLDQEQQEVIKLFFFTDGYKGAQIELFGYDHNISVRGVYRLKRIALQIMSDYITDEYM